MSYLLLSIIIPIGVEMSWDQDIVSLAPSFILSSRFLADASGARQIPP